MPNNLRERTKIFALRIIKLYSALPKTTEAQIIGKQLLRSGTSVGAHYAESQRARADAEFISKIEGGLQELEETRYWFELLVDASIVQADKLNNLQTEATELVAVLISVVKKVKERRKAKG